MYGSWKVNRKTTPIGYFVVFKESESDEEQLINDKWKKIELDDNDDALLEYFHSLRRQNERQDIISDPSALPSKPKL